MLFEFLVVLIISLIFGNGLLFLVSPQSKQDISFLKEQIQENKPDAFEEQALPGSVYVDEIYSVQASLRTANEKIKLAHERINELETSLQAINSIIVSSKRESPDFESKVKSLEKFKRNTKIELEAIKKLLKQLNEFKKIKGKKTVSAKKKEKELNKRIHELVFNTKKSN